MDKLFRILSSLRLAVALMVLLLVGLAVGTIVESRSNADIAGKLVYYSWWFIGLQALMAISIAMALVDRIPWAKGRDGFALTHASLLAILLGAGITYFFKTEGVLTLWEGGNSGSEIVQYDSPGCCEISRHTLPFSVRLDKFVLSTYPGTNKPSGYASYVQVIDTEAKDSFEAKIWMNNPLKYRGYTLFQSSYQMDGEQSATVLAVSKDPGQAIVFAGYIALLAGLIWMLVIRAKMLKAATLAAIAFFALAPCLYAQAPAPAQPMPEQPSRFAKLPVQHDGRAMPFDTYAREKVKAITGASKWQGEDPVFTIMQWIGGPEGAANAENVKIGSSDLALAMGYPASKKHAPFIQLIQNHGFLHQLQMQDQYGIPLTKTAAAAASLAKRLDAMKGVLFGLDIFPIPVPGDPSAKWTAPETISIDSLARLLDGPRLYGWPSARKIDNEIFYNELNPERQSWIILLSALACSFAAWISKRRWMDLAAFALVACGFGMMTWGIGLRWHAGERIPAANMYESMLFLAWGIGLFAVAAYGLFRNRILVLNAAAMAALAMLLTDLLPMDRFIHPIAPVLAGTPWLAIHVPIIMVGYSVLALGVLVAHMHLGVYIFCPGRKDLEARFYHMLFWYNLIGSVFLLAGILTGSMWAAFSWGRYWGWDPKEVWSLVAFLAYMAIIHAKAGKMIGNFGVAALSILAFQTILMTYLGVNFVLTIGMHSYGMGDSPIAVWMLLVALLEIAFIFVGTSAYQRSKTISM